MLVIPTDQPLTLNIPIALFIMFEHIVTYLIVKEALTAAEIYNEELFHSVYSGVFIL